PARRWTWTRTCRWSTATRGAGSPARSCCSRWWSTSRPGTPPPPEAPVRSWCQPRPPFRPRTRSRPPHRAPAPGRPGQGVPGDAARPRQRRPHPARRRHTGLAGARLPRTAPDHRGPGAVQPRLRPVEPVGEHPRRLAAAADDRPQAAVDPLHGRRAAPAAGRDDGRRAGGRGPLRTAALRREVRRRTDRRHLPRGPCGHHRRVRDAAPGAGPDPALRVHRRPGPGPGHRPQRHDRRPGTGHRRADPPVHVDDRTGGPAPGTARRRRGDPDARRHLRVHRRGDRPGPHGDDGGRASAHRRLDRQLAAPDADRLPVRRLPVRRAQQHRRGDERGAVGGHPDAERGRAVGLPRHPAGRAPHPRRGPAAARPPGRQRRPAGADRRLRPDRRQRRALLLRARRTPLPLPGAGDRRGDRAHRHRGRPRPAAGHRPRGAGRVALPPPVALAARAVGTSGHLHSHPRPWRNARMTAATDPTAPDPTAPRATAPHPAAGTDRIHLDPFVSDLDGESAALRAAGPLAAVTLPGGVDVGAVTHHAEAKKLLTDPRLVKDINVWGAWQRGEIAADWPLIGLANPPRSMLTVDGADHRRLRTLVAQALTPRRVEHMRGRITELTDSLLDRVAAEPGDTVDLKALFAYPLPMYVIADLMGLPEERLPRLKVLFEKFFSTQTPPEEVVATLTE